MKTLIHTRIYALLTQNESNPSELAHAYEEFIAVSYTHLTLPTTPYV